jgi:hypothetical protein
VLRAIHSSLGELDRRVGNPPTGYRGAAEALAPLPVKPELHRLFQVNLVPVAACVDLGWTCSTRERARSERSDG